MFSYPVLGGLALIIALLSYIFKDQLKMVAQAADGLANEFNSGYLSDDEKED